VPPPTPSTNLQCIGTATLQLLPSAGNCASGVAVRAQDLYTTVDGQAATSVTPAVGTVLTGAQTTTFTVSLGAESCTTTITVISCPDVSPERLTCKSPTYALSAGGCNAAKVPETDLYAVDGSVVTTTLPQSNLLGPGIYSVNVATTDGGASCTAVVTVKPCRPVVVSTTATVKLPNAPGTCAAFLTPSAVVSAATLGQGAVSINARTSATGSIVPPPVKAGSYYVQVVYPGNVLSNVSAGAVAVAIADGEPPSVGIKSTISRDPKGFICAQGINWYATTACLSTSFGTTGVVAAKDNCPVSMLTRKYSCTSAWCAGSSTAASGAIKVCVPVVRNGGRREAVFTLTVTDAGSGSAQVQIPVAAYHYNDPKPAGVTCYYA
jgi:hypothetical protein